MESQVRLDKQSAPGFEFPTMGRRHTTFLMLLVSAFGARLLLQTDPTEMEPVVGVALLFVIAALCIYDVRATLLAVLLIPAYFGQGEIVRTYIKVFEAKLYICDLTLFLAFVGSIMAGALGGPHEVRRFLRRNFGYLGLLSIGLLLKLIESGVNADSLRNLVMFTYSVVVPAVVCLAAREYRAEGEVFHCWLIGLMACMPCVAVLDTFILTGHKADVLKPIHQGMLQPVGVLDFLPRGTLILVGALTAAVFPVRSISPIWKVCLALFLLFDVTTYFNRAMWLGIMFGVMAGWVIRLRFSMAIAAAVASGILMLGAWEAIRTTLREGHGESSEWRLLAWNLTADRILERPFTGHNMSVYLLEEVTEGEEGVQEQAGITIGTHARYAHNSYLSLVFYGGVFLGGLVIWYIVAVYWKLARHLREVWRRGERDDQGMFLFRAFSSAIVYAALNVVLETPIEGITFWVIFALCWLHLERREAAPAPASKLEPALLRS